MNKELREAALLLTQVAPSPWQRYADGRHGRLRSADGHVALELWTTPTGVTLNINFARQDSPVPFIVKELLMANGWSCLITGPTERFNVYYEIRKKPFDL